MTQHDKLSSGVEETTRSEQVAAPSQGRRRFTKGALLATPAVMTLMSGRLAAAASSTCSERKGLSEGVEIGKITDSTNGQYTVYAIYSGEVKKTTYDSGNNVIDTSIITYDQAVMELGPNLYPQFAGVGGSCLASFV
jgi:hypothetical protein